MAKAIQRSHDQTIRHAAGQTQQATVNRILRVWHSASDGQKEEGAQWYPLHRALLVQLSRDYVVTEEHVAAVIAHMSPRVQWAPCLLQSANVLAGRPTSGIMGRSVQGAQRALQTDDPLSTLTGPKVSAFAANLLGDLDAVTVDVWAMRVAFGERDDLDAILKKRGVYDAVSHCYRLAARRVGVHPSTMQAATWVALRGRSS